MERGKRNRLIGVILVLTVALGLYYVSGESGFFSDSNIKVPSRDSGEDQREGKVQDDNGTSGDNTNGEEDKEDTSDEDTGNITFLLLGLDDGKRTDTIMVCKYFKEDGSVAILSIPRDTRVDIPGYGMDKANHAYVYGGADLTLKTINNLLNMNIDKYVSVDFKLVKDLVDELGGIEVDVPEGVYGFEPGPQILNGEQSLEVVRHRKGYTGQDLGRIDFQQEFIIDLVSQISESRNLSTVITLLRSGRENVENNISTIGTIKYLMELRNVDTSKVTTRKIDGTHKIIDELYFILIDIEELRDIAEEIFKLD